MSLTVTVCVNSGIIMASDSLRMTYTEPTYVGEQSHITRISDTEKTFLCPNGAGISTCGDHDMNGRQADAVTREFIYRKIDPNCKITQMPELISEYFSGITGNAIIAAGYDPVSLEQHVYEIKTGQIFLLNRNGDTPVLNAWWNGMRETVDPFFEANPVNFSLMTLQDAADFARFGIEITIQAQRFRYAEQTVGGPVDILAITPKGSRWIQHKELH